MRDFQRPEEIDVSVVIPNWNGSGIIEDCLGSFERSRQDVRYEVIVADNGSTDGSFESIQGGFPWVSVVRLPMNHGFASACNEGMTVSQGRYIWILNADTEVFDRTLDRMVEFMDKNPKVGALNPKMVYPDGRLQPAVMHVPTVAKAVWEEIFWHTRLHLLCGREYIKKAFVKGCNYEDVLEMEWLRGACLLVRRELYEAIGGFDSQFFFGYEEIDYVIRARRHGWKLVWMPRAQVVHKGSLFSGRFGPTLAVWRNDGAFYFWRKHRGRGAEALLRATVGAVQIAKVLALCLVWLFERKATTSTRIHAELALLRWALGGRPRKPEEQNLPAWRGMLSREYKGSHAFLETIIPTGLRLLDLGCNDGSLTRRLAKDGVREVVGVDINPRAVRTAKQSGTGIMYAVGDVERLPFGASVGSLFDGVVLADVMEHLQRPEDLLNELSDAFAAGGRLRRLFVSLPNVGYWRVRLGLLAGRFEYRDSGILDRTHRWFFTRQTAPQVLAKGGWKVLRVLAVPGYEGGGFRDNIALVLAAAMPRLFGFQFVFECVPKARYIRPGVVMKPEYGSSDMRSAAVGE